MCEDYVTMGGMIISVLLILIMIVYGIYSLCKWIKDRVDSKRIRETLFEALIYALVFAIIIALFYGIAYFIGYLVCLILAL